MRTLLGMVKSVYLAFCWMFASVTLLNDINLNFTNSGAAVNLLHKYAGFVVVAAAITIYRLIGAKTNQPSNQGKTG